MTFDIMVADDRHFSYAEEIVETIFTAAQQRGTGIAKRTPEYITQKMHEGKAIVVLLHRDVGTQSIRGKLGSDRKARVPQASSCTTH